MPHSVECAGCDGVSKPVKVALPCGPIPSHYTLIIDRPQQCSNPISSLSHRFARPYVTIDRHYHLSSQPPHGRAHPRVHHHYGYQIGDEVVREVYDEVSPSLG